jgi:hypothetical protein
MCAESPALGARFVGQPLRLPKRWLKKDATANKPNFYMQLNLWQQLKMGLAKMPNNQKPTLTGQRQTYSKLADRMKTATYKNTDRRNQTKPENLT